MNDQPRIIGDVEEQVTPDFMPALEGMGMEKTVTIYNPLPVDFRVRYVRSIAVNAPVNQNLKFAQEKAGLDLSRRGGTNQHVSHTIVLKAQSYMNLPGDIAQIAVRKLISVIIQTREDDGTYDFEGTGSHKNMVPDPNLRKEIESEIVKKVVDTVSLINTETPQAFTDRQISEMNEGVNYGPVNPAPGTEQPAPGTGVTYTPEKTVLAGGEQPSSPPAGEVKNPEVPVKRGPGRPKKTEIAI